MMRRVKLLLVATIAVGALSSIAVPGVWAIFTAETHNVQATAGTGTLVLNLTVNGGSACYSYNGPASPGNVNSSCSALYAYAPANELYPGDAPVTTQVAVQNGGSLDASDLRLYMPGGCSASQTGDAPTAGGGDPCGSGGLQISVQENASAGGAGIKCWLPAGGSSCGSSFGTVSTLASATSVTNALDLGGGPAAGQTRYFTISVQEPVTAGNNLQGEAASFVLAWHLTS